MIPKTRTPSDAMPKILVITSRYCRTTTLRVRMARGLDMIATVTGPMVKMTNATWSQSTSRSIADMGAILVVGRDLGGRLPEGVDVSHGRRSQREARRG